MRLCLILPCTCTVEYRQSAPNRLSAPPLFFHIERIGIVNAPPLVYPPPPPLFRASSFSLSRIQSRPPSRYLVSDAPTMHNERFQNVRDISRGTWPTTCIYSLSLHARCSRHDHRSRPVGVAVVVRQWRGSKHFCKHDVPSQLQRYLSTAAALHGRRTHTVDRGTYVTAHAR